MLEKPADGAYVGGIEKKGVYLTITQAKWLAFAIFVVGMILTKWFLTWLFTDVLPLWAVHAWLLFVALPCVIATPFIFYRHWKSGGYRR